MARCDCARNMPIVDLFWPYCILLTETSVAEICREYPVSQSLLARAIRRPDNHVGPKRYNRLSDGPTDMDGLMPLYIQMDDWLCGDTCRAQVESQRICGHARWKKASLQACEL